MTTANGQTPAPFMQDAPAVISTLGTDAHQGLTSEQAAHNLNQYGPNAFTKPKPESMLSRIVKTAADPMLIMLMIAAAITLGVNITRAMAGAPWKYSALPASCTISLGRQPPSENGPEPAEFVESQALPKSSPSAWLSTVSLSTTEPTFEARQFST